MEFATIKGFRDILPEEAGRYRSMELAARTVFRSYGYGELRTPLLERTELFSRSIGQDTDIVAKEMYSFSDSKGNGLTLRPEATASVVRAYIQNRLYQGNPVQKLFTIGPMFRHERPQKGRFRQFHQINAEMFGDPGPGSDADVIVMAMHLFEQIGLGELELHLNSLGCDGCRPAFKEKLQGYLASRSPQLCPDCQRRSGTNPLRVFDCKVAGCRQVVREAPSILKFICGECRPHFETVQTLIEGSGVGFVLNPQLVRGLDYYNRTTFEIRTRQLGAQDAVAGGGRYDGLVKLLGGPDHPAIGFAVGMERAAALLELQSGPGKSEGPELFVAALGGRAETLAFQWMTALRKEGFWVETDYGSAGLKAKMKRADRLTSRRVLIVGDEELESGRAILRDMNTREQQEVAVDNLVTDLKRTLSADD